MGTTIPGARLRERGEKQADGFAVALSGYEDFALALLKAQKLNHLLLNLGRGGRYSMVPRLDKSKKYEMEYLH